MKIPVTILATLVAVFAGIFGLAYSGLYDVSASSPHGTLAGWLLSVTSDRSVVRHASEIEVPRLDDMDLVLEGANDYEAMCAGCHGAPGKTAGPIGLGLNPPPPDLAVSATELTPAELFWITKHGIKMTGMPSWGATHNDELLWPVVAFVAKMPDLDSDEYRELVEQGSGHGHHADSESMAPPDHDETTAPRVHIHSDGSEHVHEEQGPESADEADGAEQ